MFSAVFILEQTLPSRFVLMVKDVLYINNKQRIKLDFVHSPVNMEHML